MVRVIKMLRAKGVGAKTSNDGRGLDAVVADVMRLCASGGVVEVVENDDKKQKRDRVCITDEKTPSKKQKLLAHVDGEWVMCTLIKTKENGKQKVKLKGGTKVVVPSRMASSRCDVVSSPLLVGSVRVSTSLTSRS